MDDGPFHTVISTELRDENPPVTELRFLTFVRNDKQSKLNYKH